MLLYTAIVFNIFLVLDSSRAFSLTKNEPASTLVVKEGDSFRLSCDVDNYYEYCLFRHNEDICDFEWKREVWNLTVADCSDYEGRMEWSGNYDYYGCAITIKNAKFEDSGSWSCEIESYASGKYRGYGYNTTAEMEIQVIPKTTESDREKEKEPDLGCPSGSQEGKFELTTYGDNDQEFWSKVLQVNPSDVFDGKVLITIIKPTPSNSNSTWIYEYVGYNLTQTLELQMDVEMQSGFSDTSFCTQPQSNEIRCKSKYKSPITNITTIFFENYQFCDWGFYANYELPDENLSTQNTWTRLEDEKP